MGYFLISRSAPFLLVAIVPFHGGDAAAMQPMQCEIGAAKRAAARLDRSACDCGNAAASGYDRTPRVSSGAPP
uniref:Uncharacterized protein n=1 Tax=Ralstonia solanacearum TaxID=305 RepID=A0A0S4UZ48_RALSL|nr:exported protein of unknown function [Ralstonia solanacearum]